MKLSRTTLANFQRLSNGESIAASGLRKDIAEELRKEGLLTVRAQGSRRTMRAVDCAALRLYVEANYTMMDLDEAAAIGSGDNELTRACLAEATGDSKLVNVRSCPGFPVNAYSPIRCTLRGRELTVCPPEGSFMFISDWKEFAVDADALVVGIENMENFRMIRQQRDLFEQCIGNNRLLFVSRYPQSVDLRSWLQIIPNRYIHFGDFDLAGINIFLTEYNAYLGNRSSFLIPSDIERRLAKGTIERYNDQYQKFKSIKSNIPKIQHLIDAINRYHRCYDQEGYIKIKEPCSSTKNS